MKFEKILFHTRFREMALSALEALLDLTKVGLKEEFLCMSYREKKWPLSLTAAT